MKYLAHRIGQGRAPAGRGDPVALSIASNWAVGEGLLNENPLAAKRARDAMRIKHEHDRPVASADRYTKLKAKASELPQALGVQLDMALREFRDPGGLTQERLEQDSGLHRTYVSSAERGERNVSFEAVARWLTAVGASWSEFGEALDRLVSRR